MRLLVLSDLHLEGVASYAVPEVSFDATVLAGDIHSPGRAAVQWAATAPNIRDKPTILVAGNHEFYGARDMGDEVRQMSQAAQGGSVHLLNRRSVVIDGIRFLGCTLWTDFQLPVEAHGRLEANVERALISANARISDFQQIQMQSPAVRAGRPRQLSRQLRAEDTLAMHWVDRDWLLRELRTPFQGLTVVVTHHAPSPGSLAERYVGDPLSPAFVSDLPYDFFDVPCLWIHGHTHHS
ncbi:metallophosphoesterase, partial [Nostoc sp. NIES-2111]